MGRRPRIEYYGAIYHIIHRGNNKSFIFQKNEEKTALLNILGEVKEIFDFSLLSYVIMDNHYHFVVKVHNIPISQIMHRINTKYAKYYNLKEERSGSPFESRYRGIIVQNESYLFNLIKYIHNNPVYANICTSMSQYKWSSDMFYRMNIGNLVNIEKLLEIFSLDRVESITKYKEMMSGPPDDYKTYNDLFEQDEVIGTEKFKKSLEEESKTQKEIELDDILKAICPAPSDYELIKEASRKRYLIKYKYEYAIEALNQGYRITEIANNIKLSNTAINKILESSQ
ncbi:transposase [Tissierella sp.]|uniref:transposase n=1 Tax=Tissierella sp. TaxID=41274 RepID=UPI0028662162|nr:transposase [Tissierella sp.]MDR7857006.1 transposase [Tissierella sp.]